MKAVSPIVAGVILIGVALIAGVTASTWITYLVSKPLEASKSCTVTTTYSLTDVKYNLASGIIKAKITNYGSDDVYNFTIEADNGTITSKAAFTPSATTHVKRGSSAYVKAYTPDLGTLSSVKVIAQSCPQVYASTTSINNIDLTGNLVLNLHMDENTGIYANDSSNYGNNGTLIDANTTNADGNTPPQWTNGKYDYGLEFDGVDDYVSVADSASLSFSNIGVEVWIKPSDLPAQIMRIVGKGGVDVGNREFSLQWNGSDFVFIVSDGTTWFGEDIITGLSFLTNTWYHLAGTYDGSTIKIYVNGDLTNQGNVGSITLLDSAYPLGIGAEVYGTITQFFNGTIDEVRVYNIALTAGQIKDLLHF